MDLMWINAGSVGEWVLIAEGAVEDSTARQMHALRQRCLAPVMLSPITPETNETRGGEDD
jgi:hypothetical protein